MHINQNLLYLRASWFASYDLSFFVQSIPMSFQAFELLAARSFAFILEGTFSLSNTDAFQISVSNKTAKSWSYLQIEQILFMYGLLEGKRTGDIVSIVCYLYFSYFLTHLFQKAPPDKELSSTSWLSKRISWYAKGESSWWVLLLMGH